MNQEDILSVKFTTLNLQGCIQEIDKVLDGMYDPYHIITANPEIVMQIRRDELPRSIADRAGMITPDGIGIVYGSKILGGEIRERVTGVELLEGLLDYCRVNKYRMFFLGADEDTISAFEKVIEKDYSGIEVAGYRNGYFDVHDDAEVVSMIQKSKADILVMGMGSPRSHKWFDSRRNDLGVKVALDVGGGFDALTGQVKRAPQWIQTIHLEWFYRRLQNPSRKDRQKDLYRFAIDVIKSRFNG